MTVIKQFIKPECQRKTADLQLYFCLPVLHRYLTGSILGLNRTGKTQTHHASLHRPHQIIRTAVEEVLDRDLSRNYPATPKEVVKFYSEITRCFYGEEYTDDQLVALADQSRMLFDDELRANQTDEQYLMNLRTVIENYKEEKSLYHLYRVESLIKHYKETGKFEYYFSEENKELAKDLKTTLDIEKHLPRLQEIFSYLVSLYKEEQP